MGSSLIPTLQLTNYVNFKDTPPVSELAIIYLTARSDWSLHCSLPTEILENIFSQTVTENDAPLTFPPDPNQWPWPLLRVSKQFQAIAEAQPDLWSKHEVIISRRLEKFEADQVINHHARLISPSPRVRLSMDLSCASRTNAPNAVWNLITLNASRIVELKFNFVYFRALDALFDSQGVAVTFPRLVSLELDFDDFRPDRDMRNRIRDSRLFNTPTLRSLTLCNSGRNDIFLRVFLIPSAFQWNHLTYLYLGYIKLDFLANILSVCRSLQHFTGFELKTGTPKEPEIRLPLQSFQLDERVPEASLLYKLPIRWDLLTLLEFGSLELNVNQALNLLCYTPSLTYLSAEVNSPPRYTPRNLFQIRLQHLKYLRLDLANGILLQCLIVPSLVSLQLQNTPKLDAFEPTPRFPMKELLQMLAQSSIKGLVDIQRRRRRFFEERFKTDDFGPRDLMLSPISAIERLVQTVGNGAKVFVMTGLILPSHILQHIATGRIFPEVEAMEFAITPDCLELAKNILFGRFREGKLKYCKVTVCPGLPLHYLDNINYELAMMANAVRGSTMSIVRAEEELQIAQIPHYDADDTDSSSDSSKSSGAGFSD
ncbi:hypothetical protein H0H87_009497 [Tephrocybe sp. NHM501043]|nr:hypothetical protein H0H87_009497 [Tephrocybe sp. NHM501043]